MSFSTLESNKRKQHIIISHGIHETAPVGSKHRCRIYVPHNMGLFQISWNLYYRKWDECSSVVTNSSVISYWMGLVDFTAPQKEIWRFIKGVITKSVVFFFMANMVTVAMLQYIQYLSLHVWLLYCWFVSLIHPTPVHKKMLYLIFFYL